VGGRIARHAFLALGMLLAFGSAADAASVMRL
jgi:hypothetical protein